MGDLVSGPDGVLRPPWAVGDALLQKYYDTEWGMPVRDERGVFERLSLEGFQAGLSWRTVLRKRERFREQFCGFDPDVVAGFDEHKVAELMADAGIIRNRAKIEGAIKGARATIALRDEGGLGELVWSFQPDETPAPTSSADIPSSSPESVAMSKELKRRGFTFVGPTICYALMEAIGIIDTHLVGSWRRGSSGVWPEAVSRGTG